MGKILFEDLAHIFGVSVAWKMTPMPLPWRGRLGSGKNKKRLIYVTVGTGIGAGIILDGQLYRGVDQAHPEIGHHVIDPSGPRMRVRIPRLLGVAGRRSGHGAAGSSNHAPSDYPHRTHLTAKRICELAQAGDQWRSREAETMKVLHWVWAWPTWSRSIRRMPWCWGQSHEERHLYFWTTSASHFAELQTWFLSRRQNCPGLPGR